MALRNALERLGPAYVKIAQAVSTRVDLLPPEYLVEIERLQDRVPPFPNVVVRSSAPSGLFKKLLLAIWPIVKALVSQSL